MDKLLDSTELDDNSTEWSGEYKGAKTELEGNDVSLVDRFEKEAMGKSVTSKFALVVYGQVAKETLDLIISNC